MLEIIERLNLAERHDAVISLDYDSRKRGRLKTLTETSEDAGLFLERGQVLMDGDYLKATDGRVVLVQAAVEQLTRASTTTRLFAKICYHLGNRHTPVEIQPGSDFFSQTMCCQTFAANGGWGRRCREAICAREGSVWQAHRRAPSR